MDLLKTLVARKGDLLDAFLQHLNISVAALIFAMLIGIPLAIWAKKHNKFAEFLMKVVEIFQTIPSLALLGLLIPLVGIGTTPAIIALVVYAILPIFRNTYLGLNEIDPSIDEAATAFGMSFMKKLWKVELPLALPVIISGIRTAFVMIVGTATLAALIGAGGLGSFILLGIDRNNVNLILIGAISSAVLAIVISALIKMLQTIKPRYTVLILALLIVGYTGQFAYHALTPEPEKIVIAGKLGAEPDILINMYRELIEEKDKNVDVELKRNFGKTSFLYDALKSNQIDIYPEFTGTVLESLVDLKTQKVPKNPEKTYLLAKKLLKEQERLEFLKPMKYENTYALGVKESFAKSNGIKSISDLAKLSNITAGFTLEFSDRPDGYHALKQKYDLNLDVKTMEPKLRYAAINNQDVQVVDAYSTDSELREYKLQLLTDDKRVFPNYQGAPLMKASFAQKHPQIVDALNKLAGKIDEKEMQEMNYQVNVKGRRPNKIAHDYLVKKGLVGDKK